METGFQATLLLLLTAAVVGMVTRRLRLPYSVGLVIAGMGLAQLPGTPRISLTKELIYGLLLPPLLFEAAFHLRWRELRRELPVIGVLATLGVMVAGAITAAGMHALVGWDWRSALVFGALIAATDPVSVIAAFREAKAAGRLPLLIEAESLFNDGTAAVAFGIAVTLASRGDSSAGKAAITLLVTVGGALAIGAATAAFGLFLIGRTDDHLIEITLTTVAAYGSFLLAERFGCSGVMATITAGLVMGNVRLLGRLSERGRQAVEDFWEYAAFAANSLVFLLIGAQVSTHQFGAVWWEGLAAVPLILLSRAATVYPLCQIFRWSSLRVTARHQHALFWGGLRGALALALAMGLPADLPGRGEILSVSFLVVAFSVFVQGTTMTPWLRKLGEIP